MEFEIKDPLGKKPKICFRCQTCRAKLTAPIQDAGKTEVCPQCKAPVAVPGTKGLEEWRRHRQSLEAKKQEAATRSAEKKAESNPRVFTMRLVVGVAASACLLGGIVGYSVGGHVSDSRFEANAAEARRAQATREAAIAEAQRKESERIAAEAEGARQAAMKAEAESQKTPAYTRLGSPTAVGDCFVVLSLVEVRPTQIGMSAEELRDRFDHGIVPKSHPLITRVNVGLISNSKTAKMEFQTWRGAGRSAQHARLRDNFGNSYKLLPEWTFPASITSEASLYPDQTIGDQLIFEPLVKGVEWVEVELPTGNLGVEGTIVVRVFASEIKRGG
jgi:hypothetical protein